MRQVFLLTLLLFVFSGLADIQAEVSDSGAPLVVELYTTQWCPYCRKAEAFLEANGIAYLSYDIERDEAAAKRKQQLDQRKGVPLAVIGNQTIYGFSERLYRTALELDE